MPDNNDAFKNIAAAFNTVAAKHGKLLLDGATNASLAAAKAAYDQARIDFPQPLAADIAADLYIALKDPQLATGVSTLITSLDKEKLEGYINKVKTALKNPEVSLRVTVVLQAILKTPAGRSAFDSALKAMNDTISALPLLKRLPAQAALIPVNNLVNKLKNGTKEEAAQSLTNTISLLPAGIVASLLATELKKPTPAAGARQLTKLVDETLPTPQALAVIFHEAGAAASVALQARLDGNLTALDEFVLNAQEIVERNGGPKAPKKGPKPPKGPQGPNA